MIINLINPPFPKMYDALEGNFKSVIPFGLAYIAAVLEKEGYFVNIIDMYALQLTWDDLRENLKAIKPSVIGITSTTVSYPNALKAAAIVKELNPKSTVVMGGPHVTFMDKETLKESLNVDIIVRGEGEYTMLELVKALENKDSLCQIKGISYRLNGQIKKNPSREFLDPDDLPLPARKLLEMDRYTDPGGIITSRGCPQRCNFCASGAMSGRHYRVRSPKNVVDEIEELYRDYNIKTFDILDDTFTAVPKRTMAICEEIINRQLNIEFWCASRVDVITSKLLEKLKSAGCTLIQCGVESGSAEILGKIGKGINLNQVREAAKLARNNNLLMQLSFIVGHPQETKQSVLQTVGFIKELQQLGIEALLFLMTPYPGTRLWNNLDEL